MSATITVGNVPLGLAITPDGKHAYVTNYRRWHGVGDHDRDRCGVGPDHRRHDPHGVAITPDGKRAYVTNAGDGTVSVITTATGAVSAPITVGTSPSDVRITPDGKHAYVANRNDGTVSVITTATGAVSAPMTVGTGPIRVAILPIQGAARSRK